MNKKIKLESKYDIMLQNILRRRLDDTNIKVYIFGSRVSGKVKPASDIDLALDGGKKLDHLKILSELKNDFEESDIKYSVDIIDLRAIDKNFRKHINADLVEIEY